MRRFDKDFYHRVHRDTPRKHEKISVPSVSASKSCENKMTFALVSYPHNIPSRRGEPWLAPTFPITLLHVHLCLCVPVAAFAPPQSAEKQPQQKRSAKDDQANAHPLARDAAPSAHDTAKSPGYARASPPCTKLGKGSRGTACRSEYARRRSRCGCPPSAVHMRVTLNSRRCLAMKSNFIAGVPARTRGWGISVYSVVKHCNKWSGHIMPRARPGGARCPPAAAAHCPNAAAGSSR